MLKTARLDWSAVSSAGSVLYSGQVRIGSFVVQISCTRNCIKLLTQKTCVSFYRTMRYSAKNGLVIACHLSAHLSVCNLGGL